MIWLHLHLSQDIQDIPIKWDSELFIFLIHIVLSTKAYCRFCIVRYLKTCSYFMVSLVLKSPKIPPFEVLDFKISWGRSPRPRQVHLQCSSSQSTHALVLAAMCSVLMQAVPMPWHDAILCCCTQAVPMPWHDPIPCCVPRHQRHLIFWEV